MKHAFAWALVMVGWAGCAGAPPQESQSPAVVASVPAGSSAPVEVRTAAPEADAAPAEPPIGIPACDEYLALYTKCEPKLKPEIMSGVRRFAHAERAWIRYTMTTPEGASLPQSCAQMLAALRPVCEQK